MKKLLFITSLIILTLFSSCSIHEDVTFKSNGQISYNMTFDLTEMIKISPDATTTFSDKADTTISFNAIIAEKLDSSTITDEQKKYLKDIEPLNFRYSTGEDNSEAKIFIFGDFKNSDALNKAFTALYKLEELNNEKEGDSEDEEESKDDFMDEIFNIRTQYQWNGKKLEIVKTMKDNQDSKESDSDLDFSMAMFSSCTIKTAYHFEKKVKTVNDANATYSLDGKSVFFNYTMSEYANKKNNSIIIETE